MSSHSFVTCSVSIAPVGLASVTFAVIVSTPMLLGATGTVYVNVTYPAAFVVHARRVADPDRTRILTADREGHEVSAHRLPQAR